MDFETIEAFVQLLARAVRQFHTYPATSPLCLDAIAACQKALSSLDRRDRLVMRVSRQGLIVDESAVASPLVDQEITRRLHAANVIALDIDRAATTRDLSRFCAHLSQADRHDKATTTLAERLADDGVESILVLMAHRPEVFDVGAPPAPVCDLVEFEKRRRLSAVASGPSEYLYPADKGWVRLDPCTPLDDVSLVDLAVLVHDPAEIAAMLLRLTGDDPDAEEEPATPLERKFSDVSMLFASLDPRLARVMFARLAGAVLTLEPDRRKNLLRRTILPALLDGRSDGSVLCDFPDVDLVDSLCLLFELETAAPEVLAVALRRLDLPADRRDAVLPMVNARLRGGDRDTGSTDQPPRGIDRLAQGLLRIDVADAKDFSEFAAFDLSMDAQAADAIVEVRQAIGAADQRHLQLGCLAHLVRLEPNPATVRGLLGQVLAGFAELERRARWHELAAWASKYDSLSRDLRRGRPDAAEAIADALASFQTPARVAALADLHNGGTDTRQAATAVIEAFGAAVVPGIIAILDDPSQQSKTPAVVGLMCAHARVLAPALAALAPAGTRAWTNAGTTRAVVKVLGFAGAGYEEAIGEQLEDCDDQTSREALRALARIGTTQAAALVAAQLQDDGPERRAAAEEALWRFPAERASAQARRLLGSRQFVVQFPQVASRLMTRAANTGAGAAGLKDVLAGLEPLRFRFWNPGLVRVALKARALQGR